MLQSHPQHLRFLLLLPRIETHAKIYFRAVRCAARRADQIAETIALTWKWFLKLEARGKDVTQFVSAIATFAAKAVRCGRKLAGMNKSRDVMNERAQKRHGFSIEKLPVFETLSANPLTEALADNTVTPPPDAAAFRVDFPCWLDRLSKRDRYVANDLMIGERTLDMAKRYQVSPARMSQLRRELCADWAQFHGEAAECARNLS